MYSQKDSYYSFPFANKKGQNKKQSSSYKLSSKKDVGNDNSALDIAEMIVDYSSPRSAVKRIIKNFRNK
ncbi:hypothetical protein BFG57_09645 [Bacillus solimangrovi]|uniref:Uncharacterized protein n=1 Tax=Bacillus solimangrovi TaxID=1305675 RepID=A0A1E5LJ36_9BACI|nr:hypothetical protein BFG57_09645 [Bacillus solimangrovi]